MNVILVAGPSGSGKDTLLRSARASLADRDSIIFARRYVTRPPDKHEDNYYIDKAAFACLQKSGFFLSTWQAHRNSYGIPQHIFRESNGYNTIVCSISRSAIGDFGRKYAQAQTILVTAERAVLRERLLKRGRESLADIERRLDRAAAGIPAGNLIVFDNSEPLEISRIRFTSLLERIDATAETVNLQEFIG